MAENHSSDSPEATTPGPEAVPPGMAPDRMRHLSAVPRKGTYTPRHTRRVRFLRVVLPIIGLFGVVIVVLWPRIRAELNRPTETSADERAAKMVNGRYVGTDSHGRPYTVTYESAQQPPGGGPIDMVNPIAELTLQNGHWVAIKADRGRYDQSASLVDLYGHVEFFHDDGYRFTSEVVHVEFSKNLIWGDRAVIGRGPKAEIEARAFRVINNGDAFTFTGPAHLLLRPDAAGIDEPGEASQ
jgi:lipopolysaccharide export system protein LptC